VTAGPGSNEFGLARLAAAAGPPNGLSGAGHKRRRHGRTNDVGKATNGSSVAVAEAGRRGF
jgi:hypothetical protein